MADDTDRTRQVFNLPYRLHVIIIFFFNDPSGFNDKVHVLTHKKQQETTKEIKCCQPVMTNDYYYYYYLFLLLLYKRIQEYKIQ